MKMRVLLLFSLCFFASSLAQEGYPEIDRQWWKHTIIYEILPFSFKDSNGDGIGDIKGITSKLPHFQDLGIETLHLTPMFKSELRDMGYDIYDYYDIDSRFGTMDDFDELVREMKKRNMKLILDLVINHSSHKHEWFQLSVQGIKPYSDFYIWKDPKNYDKVTGKPIPPNKWVSVFSGEPGSAWTWNEQRKQFYFHQFLPEQVDFDLRNKKVKNRLKRIIKFWLDKGVAGFRLDAAIFFIEDKYFRDDNNQIRQYNQKENYAFIHELRKYLDEYNEQHGGIERIFLAEAHSKPSIVRKFYDQENYHITHFPYNFFLRYIDSEITARQLGDIIEPWLLQIPENATSTWMTQDHDGHRVGSRIGPEYMDILTTISMMLPGNVGVYYGQEIGMMDGSIEQHQIRDHSGGGTRDPARLIMQWDASKNAGFSTSDQPFLPPNPDYLYRNVEMQKQQRGSHYQLFKDLSNLRKSDTFKFGGFASIAPATHLYIFERIYKHKSLLVLTNLGSQTYHINLSDMVVKLRHKISIVATSTNLAYEKGTVISVSMAKDLSLTSYSCVVLEICASDKGSCSTSNEDSPNDPYVSNLSEASVNYDDSYYDY